MANQSTIGGFQKNGPIPRTNQSYPTSSGIIGGMSQPQTLTQPNQSYATGNIAGVYQPKDTTMKGVSTPPTVNVGGKEQVMKGSPSVLAQQKAMNLNGAGLVEDGMAGELTKAAIASGKYNALPKTEGAPTSTTPAKTETTPTPKVESAPLTTAGQVPGLINSGQQTTNEQQTYSGLMDKSNTPIQGFTDKQARIDKINEQITALKSQYAGQVGAIGGQGADLVFKTGESASMRDAYNQNLIALTDQLNAETGQLGALNTQQQTQVTAGTAANTAAQTQAARATGVAGTAVSAVAPIAGVQYGTQTIQPGMLGQNGGTQGGVQPNDPYYATLQNYAQMAANGQYGAIPSSVTGNAMLNDQMNQMAKTINPSYNPVTSAAQTNITTQQAGNVANMTASYQSAANLGSQLKDLITTYGVNPNDLNAANRAIQAVAANTSSPQYQALNNLVTDLVATYSSILTPGSTTDTARATAASLLNDTASGKSIMTTLNNLDDQAKAKIAGQTTSYGANPGTSGSTTGGNMFGSFFPQ